MPYLLTYARPLYYISDLRINRYTTPRASARGFTAAPGLDKLS